MVQIWATVCDAALTLYHHWTIPWYQLVPKTKTIRQFLIYCDNLSFFQVAAGLKKNGAGRALVQRVPVRSGRGFNSCRAGRGGAGVGTKYNIRSGIREY